MALWSRVDIGRCRSARSQATGGREPEFSGEIQALLAKKGACNDGGRGRFDEARRGAFPNGWALCESTARAMRCAWRGRMRVALVRTGWRWPVSVGPVPGRRLPGALGPPTRSSPCLPRKAPATTEGVGGPVRLTGARWYVVGCLRRALLSVCAAPRWGRARVALCSPIGVRRCRSARPQVTGGQEPWALRRDAGLACREGAGNRGGSGQSW